MGKKATRKNAKAMKNLCADLKSIHDFFDQEAGRQEDKGNSAAAEEAARSADEAKADAKKWGCKWAKK